jgi:hypothetical protein
VDQIADASAVPAGSYPQVALKSVGKTKMTAIIGATWNIAGLLMNLGGVILLFLFGIPFRVRTGSRMLRGIQLDPNDAKREWLYAQLGWLGLILIVSGTVSQVFAAALAFKSTP